MALTYFSYDVGESRSCRERAAAVCTKTEIVVQLISPREACERCEVHGRKYRDVIFVVQELELKDPPTTVGGIQYFRRQVIRLELKLSTNCRWWNWKISMPLVELENINAVGGIRNINAVGG